MLLDDGEDFDRRFCNVIEHPDVADSQPVLWLAQAPQPFDPALAKFCGLMSQPDVAGALIRVTRIAGNQSHRIASRLGPAVRVFDHRGDHKLWTKPNASKS